MVAAQSFVAVPGSCFETSCREIRKLFLEKTEYFSLCANLPVAVKTRDLTSCVYFNVRTLNSHLESCKFYRARLGSRAYRALDG